METFWVNTFTRGFSLTSIDDATSEQDALEKALRRYPAFDGPFFQGQTRMVISSDLPFVTNERPSFEPCEESVYPPFKYADYRKSDECNTFIVRQEVIYLESINLEAPCSSSAIEAAEKKLSELCEPIELHEILERRKLDYLEVILIYAGPIYVTQPSIVSPIDDIEDDLEPYIYPVMT